MLNRNALILKYRGSFVEWLNSVDGGGAEPLSLDEANADPNVYLIEVDVDEDSDMDEAFDVWLAKNFSGLLEDELDGWDVSAEFWPEDFTLDDFLEWFEVSFHTSVMDAGMTPLADED